MTTMNGTTTNGVSHANGVNGTNGYTNGHLHQNGTNGYTNGYSHENGTSHVNGHSHENGTSHVNGHSHENATNGLHMDDINKKAVPIAICGIGLRLPGGNSTPQQFWEFLVNKGDARDRRWSQATKANWFGLSVPWHHASEWVSGLAATLSVAVRSAMSFWQPVLLYRHRWKMLVLRCGTKRLSPAARPVVAKTPLGLPALTGAGGALPSRMLVV